MPEEHHSLFEQACSGDSKAMDLLLERHRHSLRAFIRLRMGQEIRERESVSDLVQSVFREALDDADDFDYRGENQFKGWLYTKALSKIRDRWRYYTAQRRDVHREVRVEPKSGEGALDYGSHYAELVTPSQMAIGQEQMQRIEKAFDELPEDYREIITLIRIAGLSHKEAGERTGRSEEASRALLRRALMALSWILTGHQ